jgi:LacI family transcriptional regulator
MGYLDAMSEAGIDVPDSWIMEESLTAAGGEKAFESGIKWTHAPDAYFCAGDYAALGVLQAAQSRGLVVPSDLGITGFANEPFTEFVSPALTSVDQRSHEMGMRVAKMFLLCEREGISSRNCDQVVLDPQLVIRESSILHHKN